MTAITAAVIVAHPDDETLWAGGTILKHRDWKWYVVSLCRAGDADRSPKFQKALAALGAVGTIGDLDDGPEQTPLSPVLVRNAVLSLLPVNRPIDLMLTHGPQGEYTRHRRHEETCRAVISLWAAGMIFPRRLWTFAYNDDGKRHLPEAAPDADLTSRLPADIRRRKYAIITGIYGFTESSFEARTTPGTEAFRSFTLPVDAYKYLNESGGLL
ncbi:MAG: PIG-L family deacetylase [Chitinispirillaceae bacterium]|nr:PIG-L family deacetylase [Chitinispirillaceae bacterium]